MNERVYNDAPLRRHESLLAGRAASIRKEGSDDEGGGGPPDAKRRSSLPPVPKPADIVLEGLDEEPVFALQDGDEWGAELLLAADGKPRTSIFADDASERSYVEDLTHAAALLNVDCRRFLALIKAAARRPAGHQVTPLFVHQLRGAAGRLQETSGTALAGLRELASTLGHDKSVQSLRR